MAKAAIKIYLKSAIESGFKFIRRSFENLEELNENFHAQRTWIFERMEKKADYKRRLVKVLEVLKMHSCKYVGISFMTENRLCEAYEALHGEAISKRSAGAYIKQLREIGFIKTIAAKREDGKQTANIVVIEKVEAAGNERAAQASVATEGEDRSEKPAHKESENLRTDKTTSPNKTSSKENRERITKTDRLLNFVPQWFKEQISCYTGEAKPTYELWKVAKHLMSRTFGTAIDVEERQVVVRKAVREFYLSAKASVRGKFKMRNPFGFFYSILEAEGHAHARRKAQSSSSVLYDWLEE